MIDKFPTERNLQRDLSKIFFSLISLFQLSMHLINSSPNKCKKYSCGKIFEAAFISRVYLPGVTGDNYIRVGTNIWSFIQDLNPQLYLPLIWPSFWVLIIWAKVSKIYIIFAWVIKIISECWCLLIKHLPLSEKLLLYFATATHSLSHTNFTVSITPF